MSAPQFQFTRAARHAVKLKIGIDGPSGSGKTLGALALARGITNGGRIAVADSENDSASLYSDQFEFDRVVIPDANPETYKAIIDAAVAAGYDALVIDSISHAWLTVLAEKEEYDRRNPKSNQWTNWRLFGPKWDGLIAHILHAPIHVIATMRSKQAYEQVDTGGKKQVVKLGLQPQVRDGAEYEFGIVFSVDQSHQAEATKDRTRLFAGRQVDLTSPALHQELVAWMNAGGEAPPAPAPARPQLHVADAKIENNTTGSVSPGPVLPNDDAIARAKAMTIPFKNSNAFGKRLDTLSLDGLQSFVEWIEKKQAQRGPKYEADLLAAMRLLLNEAERAGVEADDDVPGAIPAPAPVDTQLAPGKIADALDKPSAPSPKDPTFTELATSLDHLLRDEWLAAEQRQAFLDESITAVTEDDLRALIGKIEEAIVSARRNAGAPEPAEQMAL